MAPLDELVTFLNEAPTAWHAVDWMSRRLIEEGFQELHECDKWQLQAGGKYFVAHRGSSLAAFIVPQDTLTAVRLAASHTDSPGFRLKPHADYLKENMLMLGLEVYGAPLLTSWLNRDLGIAGKIYYTLEDGSQTEELVKITDIPVVIPQLAIHLDRDVNESGLKLNKQDHLAALLSVNVKEKNAFETLLKKRYPIQTLLSTDLFLYPLEPAKFIGEEQALVAGYRIDSLNSVHAILRGLLASQQPAAHELKMAVFWDHEEIGSSTTQGASSPFFSHLLERITLALNLSRDDFLRIPSQSFCVSVDLTHGLHPNYIDRHEPRHHVLLGKGIAIKYSAQQRYATNGFTAVTIADLCHTHQIPFQKFVTRGDIPAGTTIGPLHATVTGMPTVDIGAPQLSMHACRELASCQDHVAMCSLLTHYFK